MNTSKETTKQNHQQQDWKVFRKDTEAGRLLSRLYGVDTIDGKPSITYPKLKTTMTKNSSSGSSTSKPNWNSGTHSSGDGSTTTKGELDRRNLLKKRMSMIKIPKVGQQQTLHKNPIAAVHSIPRRRTEAICHLDIEANKSALKLYRPPNQIPSSTDVEKDRLNDLFMYRGGCALPDELMSPKQDLPDDIKARERERLRVEKMKAKRNERINGNVTIITEKEPKPDVRKGEYSYVDQIVDEIQERRRFQVSMEHLGSGDVSRDKIAEEISVRMKELEAHDPKRAASVLQMDL